MNKVQLVGRLVREPEISTTGSGIKKARFTMATDGFTRDSDSDFHTVTAWRQTADIIENYFHKGSFIIVDGSLSSGQYEKDGVTKYTYEVTASRIEFGPKNNSAATAITTPGTGSAEVNRPAPQAQSSQAYGQNATAKPAAFTAQPAAAQAPAPATQAQVPWELDL